MIYLLLLLVIPIVGAAACAGSPRHSVRQQALVTILIELAVAVGMLLEFDFGYPLMQFTGTLGDLTALGVSGAIGIDSISLWLILLTVGLMPLAIAASFDSIKDREREYYAWMLLLTSAMLGVFMARDALIFYVFFELTLIPMFFIIGIWGGPDRRYAAGKFFLFTFAGSIFTLAAIVYVGLAAGTFDIVRMSAFAQGSLSESERFWVLLGLLAGFAVKVPIFPVHTWLPLAHTEAPTAGSVILAGVLLKLGTYGLLRLALPIGFINANGGAAFPQLMEVLGGLCLVGVLYGAVVAWVQQDIKKLVAYSSVSHLGFCVLGLVALNDIGIQGSVLYMINHGLSTGALFLVIGMIYDRYHTRDIDQLSGLARKMPIMAFFFVLFTMSSIGLPGLNGFVSEFTTILAAFTSPVLGPGYGALAALGIILGAVYMLHMTARVIFGPLKVPGNGHGHGHEHGAGHAHDSAHAEESEDVKRLGVDLNRREIAILVPLAIAVIVLGVRPTWLTEPMMLPGKLIRTPVAMHHELGPAVEFIARDGTLPRGDDTTAARGAAVSQHTPPMPRPQAFVTVEHPTP